jgi:hypothetical protein
LDNLTAETLLFDEATFTGQLLTDPAITNVQDALILLDTHDHVVADITDLSAATVSYDNDGQNLVATDVQAAINEIDDLVEEGLTQVVVTKYNITDADSGTNEFEYNINGGSTITGTISNGVYLFDLPSGIEYVTGGNRLTVKIDNAAGAVKRLFYGADSELSEPSTTSFGVDYPVVSGQGGANGFQDNDALYAKIYQSLATVSIDIADGSVTQSKIADGAVVTTKIADSNVTLAKLQNIATLTVLGNDTGGTANVKAMTAAETKTLLALNNVDNTSDLNKPISSNTQTALDGKAAVVHTHVISDVTNLQTTLDAKATTVTLTATALETGWTGSEAPFSQEITGVTGLTTTDNPTIDLTFSGTYATDETRNTEWGKVYRAVTGTNSITLFATEVPEADLPFQIKVVR